MTAAPKKKPPAKAKKKAVPKGKAKASAKKSPAKKRTAKKASAKRKTSAKQAAAPKSAPAPRTRFKKWARRITYALGGCALFFVLTTVVWAGTLRFVNPPFTGLMIMRQLKDDLPINKVWRNYEDISPHFLLAVLAAEDQRFYDHHGFDLKEIKNAIEASADGGRMRGASTLSQQTAKNVFLWPARSWWRKGTEVYFTVLIEALWPKRRILEVYVNVAEMGAGIYGVESAAQRYFGKPAGALTPEESALIAAILPNPLKRNPKAPTAYLKKRQTWILGQMNNLGGTRFLQ